MRFCRTFGLVFCSALLGNVVSLGAPSVWADTLLVPSQHATLQGAIDAAAAGDTISVAAGTYVENLVIAKEISLIGAGPEVTTIDGSAVAPGTSSSVVRVTAGVVVIEGFTITGGTGTNNLGGGINASAPSTTIRNCHVLDNLANFDGGGIWIDGEVALIEDCVITGNSAGPNTAGDGGGIHAFRNGGNVVIRDCQVNNNSAGKAGGGILIQVSNAIVENCECNNNTAGIYFGGLFLGALDGPGIACAGTVSNCIVDGNTAGAFGGGLGTSEFTGTFADCTISNNIAGDSAGCLAAGDENMVFYRCIFSGNVGTSDAALGTSILNTNILFDQCTVVDNSGQALFSGYGGTIMTLRNCIVSNNDVDIEFDDGDNGANANPNIYTIEYTNTAVAVAGIGNMAVDPMLDRNLKPLPNSPMIDAGDPNSPLDPDGSTTDLGAIPFVLVEFMRGDVDGDSDRDLTDGIATLNAMFLGASISCADAADFNDDGALTLTDPLALFQYLFLSGALPTAPFECGDDPTPDSKGCDEHAGCSP